MHNVRVLKNLCKKGKKIWCPKTLFLPIYCTFENLRKDHSIYNAFLVYNLCYEYYFHIYQWDFPLFHIKYFFNFVSYVFVSWFLYILVSCYH